MDNPAHKHVGRAQGYEMHRCINFPTKLEDRDCAVLLREVLPYSRDELHVAETKRKERLLMGLLSSYE